ncbi:MAG TPA: phage holin family protein [Dehalococcoidia bacterium]|nr:phage holin family protein [Dehalococcoidia bacterium]
MRGVSISFRSNGPQDSPDFGPWLMGLLIRWAINAVALVVAAALVPGIELEGWESTLITAGIFGIVNALIRPFVMCITCLLQVLTLGLFTLIVNAAMLALTAWAADGLGLEFEVDGFWAAFLGALVISLVSFVLTRVAPPAGRGSERSRH